MTGDELYAFFHVPEQHRLFLESPGKDPDIPIPKGGTPHTIRNGSHFYDLPSGQFGGMLPRLEKEVGDLRSHYGADHVTATLQPDGTLCILIDAVTLPAGWSKAQARLHFHAPPAYPQARPDGFYTDTDLQLEGNKGPGKGAGDGPIDGTPWRKYCWTPKTWEMSRETMLRYARFCETRFLERE